MTVLFQPLTTPYAAPPAAPITAEHCAALLSALDAAAHPDPDLGHVSATPHQDARRTFDVTALPLARLARIVDYDLPLISVLEEAQFLGRLVALTGTVEDGDLALGLADIPLRSIPAWRAG